MRWTNLFFKAGELNARMRGLFIIGLFWYGRFAFGKNIGWLALSRAFEPAKIHHVS